MKDMKLIMESWKKYTEEDLREQIANYIEENNIVLTEEQINEAMPRWLKKLGGGAALAATLAGAGTPSAAQASPSSEPTHQTAQTQAKASQTGFHKNAETGNYEFRVSTSDPTGDMAGKMEAKNGLVKELVKQGVLKKNADGSVTTQGLTVGVERAGSGYVFVAKWSPESADAAGKMMQQMQSMQPKQTTGSSNTRRTSTSDF